jgi:hypothetical protein
MHPSRTLDGGMDVHHDALAVASVANDPDAAVVFRGALGASTRRGRAAHPDAAVETQAPGLGL